jgi:NADH:quinone reductase (non-electrogenic)
MPARVPRIVILGGGFGGLYCALELEKRLARRGLAEVTLVNRENFFLFTPMLHEVAASDLDVTHIVNPVRKLLRHVRFWAGEIEAIDTTRRIVRVAHGGQHHDHELPYDHLVVALGSVTNYHGIEGVAARALAMKSLGDAITLRNRLIANLEQADAETSAGARRKLLTLVVAGGGFAGVETVAGVNDFLHHAIRWYPNLRADELRLVLVHSGELILPELGPELGAYAQQKLAARGVEIVTGARVTAYDEGRVRLADGSSVECDTLVWTAGTSPNPLLAGLPGCDARGRLVADATLRVSGPHGLWALGDAASVTDPATGRPYPPTAQHALRQGRALARNLEAALLGKPLAPFRFRSPGALAAIGRRTGVARIFGVNFSGFLAWWMWRTVYLAKLPRFEKKLRVMLDWTLDLVFAKDLVQFMTFRSEGVSHPEEARP